MYYITALTALLESIALIVDQHQPVVEKYYGPGKMVPVIQRLIKECDKAIDSLLDGWTEERSLKRKVSLHGALPLSPHPFQQITEILISPPPVHSASARQAEDPNTIDPREIDKVLIEISGMTGRWSIFVRFLYDSLQVSKVRFPS